MAVHIETQSEAEVQQIRSRELQLENVNKLNQIMPIVDNMVDVNLSQIESDTSDIKYMIEQNLDTQVDLDKIYEAMINVTKGLTEIKKANTRLSNAIKDTQEQIKTIQEQLEE